MGRNLMLGSVFAAMVAIGMQAPQVSEAPAQTVCGDSLMPLEHTAVSVDVAGMAARVTVVQRYTNKSKTPIEAIYTFPMAEDAAVDRMRIRIGERIIEGEIKEAGEARRIYDQARAAGQVAALLDQERPNIFTQSIANIMPGAVVEVEISYVETLDYEDGEYEFAFPMVVGPRNVSAAPDPDAINPPVAATRTGHNISMRVRLDAGASLKEIGSTLHEINVTKHGAGQYTVTLANEDEIPNRDFILRWRPAVSGISDSLVAHIDGDVGTFCYTLFPPRDGLERIAIPRELVFVMDQSGSQSGMPIEKSKEMTNAMIDAMRPGDAFNVITFDTDVNKLWQESMPATPANRAHAKKFVSALTTGGGTNFVPPLQATVTQPALDGRLKMVIFNTDGYIGNEFEILKLVRENRRNARLFTVGIGNSINRFLVEGMAAEGRGACEIVTLQSSVDEALARFMARTQTPVLSDIRVTASGGGVHAITPSEPVDLFGDSPIMIFGRYTQPGEAWLDIEGTLNGREWNLRVQLDLPAVSTAGDGVTKVWARRTLDDMVRDNWMLAQTNTSPDFVEATTPLVAFALEHGLLSKWTSFVAVEKRVVNVGGEQRTVRVPVEQVPGLSYLSGGVPAGIVSRSYDPVANSLIVGGLINSGGRGAAGSAGGFGGGRGGGGAPPPEQQVKSEADRASTKVDASLRGKTEGSALVQVLVSAWPEDWREQLEKAGLKVDDRAADLKAVFGKLDLAKAEDLAKLDWVVRIDPLL